MDDQKRETDKANSERAERALKSDLDNVKILFIANEEKPLISTFNFLKKRGWVPLFAQAMKDAVTLITENQPTHVMISWNLSNANIPRMEKTITATFQIPCIVFTEKVLDGKQQGAVTSSGIKQYILAPLSGPSVHMKIRKIIMDSSSVPTKGETQRRKSGAIKNFKEEKIEIRSRLDDVPKDGEWEQAGTSGEGEPIWMLKSKKKGIKNDKKKGTYVFKGKAPPMLDDNGNWRLPVEGGTLGFTQEELEEERQPTEAEVESLNQIKGGQPNEEDSTQIKSLKAEAEETVGSKIQSKVSNEKNDKSIQIKKSEANNEQEINLSSGFGKSTEATTHKRFEKTGQLKQQINVRTSNIGTEESEDEVSLKSLNEDTVEAANGKRKGISEEEKLERQKIAAERKAKVDAERQSKLDERKKAKEEREEQKRLELEKAKVEIEGRQKAAAEKALERELERRSKGEQRKKDGVKISSKPDEGDVALEGLNPSKPKSLEEEIEAERVKAEKELAKQNQKKSEQQAKMHMGANSQLGKGAEKEEGDEQAQTMSSVEKKEKESLRQGQNRRATSEQAAKLHEAESAVEKEKQERKAIEREEKAKRSLTPAEREKIERAEREQKSEKTEKSVDVQAQGSETQSGPSFNHGELSAVQVDPTKEMVFKNKTKLFGKKTDTILAQCVVRALEQTVVSGDVTNTVPLRDATRIDCIPINSNRFKGLLIYGTSGKEHSGAEFSRTMKNYLLGLMNERGEEMKDEGELELQLNPFSFVDVGTEFAEFVTLSQHLGYELGMAYLESDGVFPSLKPPNEKNMISVDLNVVEPGEKVGFDAYIHLPKNQKYLKYLRRNGVMETKQKDKLSEFEVRHFYIKNEDVRIFKGHCATSFVERMVKQFISAVKRAS